MSVRASPATVRSSARLTTTTGVLASVPNSPIIAVILVNARVHERHPDWGTHWRSYVAVALLRRHQRRQKLHFTPRRRLLFSLQILYIYYSPARFLLYVSYFSAFSVNRRVYTQTPGTHTPTNPPHLPRLSIAMINYHFRNSVLRDTRAATLRWFLFVLHNSDDDKFIFYFWHDHVNCKKYIFLSWFAAVILV